MKTWTKTLLSLGAALQNAGAKGLHIPYNGMAPYLIDLMGGVLDFTVVPLVGPVFDQGL